jgi:hypothetical protein
VEHVIEFRAWRRDLAALLADLECSSSACTAPSTSWAAVTLVPQWQIAIIHDDKWYD